MAARYRAADYLAALRSLLPRGRVWPGDANSMQAQVLSCMAPTLERIDGDAIGLLVDTFPATTTNFVEEWETALGLPDPCLGDHPTIDQKRAQIVARLIAPGGQSAQFFIDFAAALGFEIAITSFAPFRAGRSRVGSPLNGPDWSFAWQVTIISGATSTQNSAFRTGQGRMGDRLASAAAGLNALFCELRRVAPAHTILLLSSGDTDVQN